MKLRLPPIIVCLCLSFELFAQTKVIGECALTFEVAQIENKALQPIGTKQVFIKGNQCKTVLSSDLLKQTLIFNTNQESAIVLKEIGNNKLYQSIKYPPATSHSLLSIKPLATDSLKKILGYPCKTIQLFWNDGVEMLVDYTEEIIPTVPSFEFFFKSIPGLVLGYTIDNKKGVVFQYIAKSIDLSPINLNTFEVNKSLYQIID